MERQLNNMSQEQATANGWKILKDIDSEVIGKAVYQDPQMSIMKSTKRFPVSGGWIYNTSTEIHKGHIVSVAEALVFVPAHKEGA